MVTFLKPSANSALSLIASRLNYLAKVVVEKPPSAIPRHLPDLRGTLHHGTLYCQVLSGQRESCFHRSSNSSKYRPVIAFHSPFSVFGCLQVAFHYLYAVLFTSFLE